MALLFLQFPDTLGQTALSNRHKHLSPQHSFWSFSEVTRLIACKIFSSLAVTSTTPKHLLHTSFSSQVNWGLCQSFGMMHPQGPNKAARHTPLVSTAVGEHGPRVDLGRKALVSRPVMIPYSHLLSLGEGPRWSLSTQMSHSLRWRGRAGRPTFPEWGDYAQSLFYISVANSFFCLSDIPINVP